MLGWRVIIPNYDSLGCRDIIVTVTTVTNLWKPLDATEWGLDTFEMWWLLEADIPCTYTVAGVSSTLWNSWNQQISSSSRKYPKENFSILILQCMAFFWAIAVILCKKKADPSSYRFPDGTTMVKTEDGFNVCLGLLLDGWDVCKGTGLRPLADHVVKALEVLRISRLEKVPWSIKDTGRQFGLLSQHYPIQDGCPHRGKAKLYKDPFWLQDPFLTLKFLASEVLLSLPFSPSPLILSRLHVVVS